MEMVQNRGLARTTLLLFNKFRNGGVDLVVPVKNKLNEDH